jgi:spore maturation protein CgeB
MKFLILNTDYAKFLRHLYAQHPGLERQPYEHQMRVRNESLFGVADFYSSNLRKLGYEAWDIHANNKFLQTAWAKEHGLKVASDWHWQFRSRRGIVPWVSRIRQPRWSNDILAAQIRHYKPDVLLNQTMDDVSDDFLRGIKPYVRLLVGQIAAPLPQHKNWSIYDLVISSLPNFVEYFRTLAVPSELNRLGFEPALLPRLKWEEPEIPVSFVGSVFPGHATRVSFLEHLCSDLDIKIWANGVSRLRHDSPIRSRCVGPAWGVEMYQILHRSKMTLNHHIDIADSYANNLRLYEATGVGTMLVTDWKANLHEIFELGREVIAYRTAEECAEMIRYYLEHDEEREAIARAGQQRTLRDHTYYKRMQELVDIVQKYL